VGKNIRIVGKGGGLFAKVVFADGVYLSIYDLYACTFVRPVPVIDQYTLRTTGN
jgi:hypothetical protein